MSTKKFETPKTLAKHYGKRGLSVTIMLVVSLVFNITALFVPFTELGKLLGNSVSCTLPYSVYLMWEESLYAIAILILCFSIFFPFLKLYSLIHVWLIEKSPTKRHNTLKIIEPLGKWSMLDVFATCIILILCNKQILVYGTPMIGVNFFLAAIFLSMLASIIIDVCQENKSSTKEHRDFEDTFHAMQLSPIAKIFFIIILIFSLCTLLFAIWYPYLQISSFLLIGYSYSIYSSITSLADLSLVLAIFMFFTMIVFPILHTLSLLLYWILELFTKKQHQKLLHATKIFSRFNMLDVFLLAFVIFLLEGQSMIKIHHKLGLFLIATFIFISFIIPLAVTMTKRFFHDKHRK